MKSHMQKLLLFLLFTGLFTSKKQVYFHEEISINSYRTYQEYSNGDRRRHPGMPINDF
jgi:hypothetical protein